MLTGIYRFWLIDWLLKRSSQTGRKQDLKSLYFNNKANHAKNTHWIVIVTDTERKQGDFADLCCCVCL